MQPSTHSLQNSVSVPVNPAVRQAVGKNNIKPTTAKSHAHATGPASAAVTTTIQASVVATVAAPNANKATVDHAESDVMSIRSTDECKQKVSALLRDWDWK